MQRFAFRNSRARLVLVLGAIMFIVLGLSGEKLVMQTISSAPLAKGPGDMLESALHIFDKRLTQQLVQAGPVWSDGGIAFDAHTVVDPQRQVGEPDVVVARNGEIYASGPWGTSTQQSFAWKSVDNGASYNVIGKLRPDIGPGGGDTTTETDDQNNAYL